VRRIQVVVGAAAIVLVMALGLAVGRGPAEVARATSDGIPAYAAPARATVVLPESRAQIAAPARGGTADEVAVNVDSVPAGAQVLSGPDGRALGRTPLSVILPRGDQAIEIVIAKDGFVESRHQVVPDQKLSISAVLARKPRTRVGDRGSDRDGKTESSPQVTGDPQSGGDGKIREAISIDPFAEEGGR
jgi:hypothetical protein